MAAVTLDDVAERAGVSQPTASRVLNGSARKPGPQVVEAVRRAAEELGYIPNAQALARSATGLLGLVIFDIADPYFSAVASGVQKAAGALGFQVLLAVSLHDPTQERDHAPGLTTDRLPLEAMGERIVEMAMSTDLRPGSAAVERVPAEVILRDSTDPG